MVRSTEPEGLFRLGSSVCLLTLRIGLSLRNWRDKGGVNEVGDVDSLKGLSGYEPISYSRLEDRICIFISCGCAHHHADFVEEFPSPMIAKYCTGLCPAKRK